MANVLISTLGKLGLTERESRIYLSCLAGGDGLFIHEIVKETRITRSTVDLTVARLVRRGLLARVKVGRRYRFKARDPALILARQKQMVEDLEQVLPALTRQSGIRHDMDICYYEGAAGYRQILNDMLLQLKMAPPGKKDVLSFCAVNELVSLYPDAQKGFIDKRVRLGAWFRVIAPQSSARTKEAVNSTKDLRVAKFLPDKDYPFRIDIEIYADMVALYAPTPPIGGVTIRNAKIADSMRALFHLLWKLLPQEQGDT